MDSWGKWLRSKLIAFMVIYWGAIILLTYSLEWVARHERAFTFAGLIVLGSLVALVIIRWRRRQYW